MSLRQVRVGLVEGERVWVYALRVWWPAGLDKGQTIAAAAVASTDPLALVESAAGAGKTTMLGVAIHFAAEHSRDLGATVQRALVS